MKRIFLVEDDKEIAKNLALLLRTEGFNVTHASSQGEATRHRLLRCAIYMWIPPAAL